MGQRRTLEARERLVEDFGFARSRYPILYDRFLGGSESS
jgi:hypothetical protein